MKSSAKIVKAATFSDNHVSGTVHNLELSYETVVKHIPSALYNFLAFLMTDAGPELGENSLVSLQQQKHEQVLNMAQVLVVKFTKLPMPKHILLALHALKHTCSKDLVIVLSRFGHITSYDDAQRYLATAVQQIEEKAEEEGVYIPANLVPGSFMQSAVDNLYFHENTADGATLHATSHAVYQYKDDITGGDLAYISLQKTRETKLQKRKNFTYLLAMSALGTARQHDHLKMFFFK